jgi:hypothetical protein
MAEQERDGALSVEDVSLQRREERAILRISVHNDSDRPLHAYATARRIEYDPETRALRVELTDANRGPMPLGATFVRPKFVAVDPGGDRTIELNLPEVMHRISSESTSDSLAFEALPIHDATSVAVEVAWSDTPFYPDVREAHGRSPLEQMKGWQKGAARGEVRLERRDEGA